MRSVGRLQASAVTVTKILLQQFAAMLQALGAMHAKVTFINGQSGPHLVDIANDCATMDEVVFATPNFVSEYRRKASALPAIHREQWHLRNTARFGGQVANEDVHARGAWRITRGKRTIVVAVLDDGVDVEHPHPTQRATGVRLDVEAPAATP